LSEIGIGHLALHDELLDKLAGVVDNPLPAQLALRGSHELAHMAAAFGSALTTGSNVVFGSALPAGSNPGPATVTTVTRVTARLCRAAALVPETTRGGGGGVWSCKRAAATMLVSARVGRIANSLEVMGAMQALGDVTNHALLQRLQQRAVSVAEIAAVAEMTVTALCELQVVCCRVMQCVAVCGSVWQCVAVCCSVLRWVAVGCMLQCFAMCFRDDCYGAV